MAFNVLEDDISVVRQQSVSLNDLNNVLELVQDQMSESVDELTVLGQKDDLEYRKAQSSFFVESFHRVHKAAEKLLAFATKSYTAHMPVMRGGRLFDFVLNLENDEELKQGDFNADPGSEVKEQLFINA